MIETAKRPNVKECCEVKGRLNELQTLSYRLERRQKSLRDYLDSKRIIFPRFFFISDDDLLSVLSSSEPSCVQEHLFKVSVTTYSTENYCVILFLEQEFLRTYDDYFPLKASVILRIITINQ